MAQRPNPKTGCLTAVVRRLLCSGSQQTHPSDTILDSSDETLQLLIPYQETILEQETKKELINTKPQNDDVFEAPEEVSPPPPASNVVAKLMGLDNNPEPGSNRFRYFDDSGSAVARSKSVNFMDYILRVKEEEEEEDKDGQRQCRRVKASVSFREIVPTSARWSSSSNQNQQQKKHDFLLLYLDKLDEKRELVNGTSSSSSLSRSKRFEKVLEDSKKTKKKKEEDEKVAKKFKDEPRKVAKKKKTNKKKSNGESNDVNGAKKVRWFLSPSKSSKMTSEKTALLGGGDESSPETKSSSNASPVSVLDRDLYDYLILDDDYYFSGDSESASELSTKHIETTTTTKSSSSSSRTRTNTKKAENTNSDSSEETEFITKLMNMLSDLSEEDMNSDSSTWVSTVSSTKPVDFSQVEDFCVEFGQEILDLVMDQLVDELCI